MYTRVGPPDRVLAAVRGILFQRWPLLSGLLVASSILLIACGADGTATPKPADVKYGGILRNAQDRDPASCDLRMFRGRSYRAVFPCQPMLNQLVRYDSFDHEEIVADLAKSWKVSEDGTRWTFQLADAQWHDGVPVTAEDIKYSLDTVLEVPEGLTAGRASPMQIYIDSVQASGDETVVIDLKFPAASFLTNLASVYVSMYPKHVLSASEPPTVEGHDQVVGSGPFIHKSMIRGSIYEMERNPNYFKEGLPYLDEYHVHVIPDATVRLAALTSGEIDMISANFPNEAEAKRLKESYSDKIIVKEHFATNFSTAQINSQVPPFDDVRVRQAINLAIDREEARLILGGGIGQFGSLLPPYSQWGLPADEVTRLPGFGDKEAERAQARKLLADAGWPNGFETVVTSNTFSFNRDNATFLIDQLKNIGIRAKPEPLEAAVYNERVAAREFSIIAHGHAVVFIDPDSILGDHYTCNGIENFPQVCDSELEDLFSRQAREMDSSKRIELVQEFQRKYEEQVGKIIYMWLVRRPAYWDYVKDYEPGDSQYQQYYGRMEDVWLDKG